MLPIKNRTEKNKGVCGPEHWEPNVHGGCPPSTSIFLDLPKAKRTDFHRDELRPQIYYVSSSILICHRLPFFKKLSHSKLSYKEIPYLSRNFYKKYRIKSLQVQEVQCIIKAKCQSTANELKIHHPIPHKTADFPAPSHLK